MGGIGLAYTLAHHSLCSTAMLHLIEVSCACWVSSIGGRTVSVSAIRPDGHACFHHRRAQQHCLRELGRPCLHAQVFTFISEACQSSNHVRAQLDCLHELKRPCLHAQGTLIVTEAQVCVSFYCTVYHG